MADDFSVEIPQTVGDNPNQLAYRNNNPGNIEFNNQPGATLGEDGRFAKFPTPEDGYKYLRDVHIPKHAAQPLGQYISQYAPPNENDTARYIADAAKATGATPDTPVGQIDREKLAQFQIQKESQAKVVPHDEFDKVIHGDEFDQVIHGKAEVKPGQIPLPPPNGVRRPGSWDPKLDTLENISNQAEDILPSVARNVGGMISSAGDVVKGIFHRETPEETQQKLADWSKPFGQQVRDLPVVGPLAEGRIGQAVGDVATGALLGRIGGGAAEEGAVRGVRPALPDLLQPRTPAEANFLQSSKPLAEIIDSPKGAGRFQNETLRDVMPIIQKEAKNWNVGKIDSYDKLNSLVDQAYQKHNAAYHEYLDRARGAVIDRGAEGIPQAMIQAIPKNIELDNPAVYQDLVDQARQHGTPVKVQDLDQVRMDNNALLRKYENATGADQAAIARAQGSTAMLKAEQMASRDALYRKIDPESNGQNVAEINRRLGSLIETRAGLNKLNDSMIRQNDPNAVQKMAQHAKDVVTAALNPVSGSAKVMMKKIMAEPDVNGKIKQAFGGYKGQDLPDVPGPRTRLALPPGATRVPPTDTTRVNITTGEPLAPPLELTAPPGTAEFSRQRGLNEQLHPDSRMDTDYRQQTQDLPVHGLIMRKGEPAPTFNWQKYLFGEDPKNPEKATAINPRKLRKPPNPSHPNAASGTPPPVEDEIPFKHGIF